MRMFTKRDKRTNLEKEIDNVLKSMEDMVHSSKEYTDIVNNLSELYTAKTQDKSCRISPDTLLIAGCNIAGILLILKYEKMDIVTSKAIGFIMRGRV